MSESLFEGVALVGVVTTVLGYFGFGKRDASLASLVPPRSGSRAGGVNVTSDSALYMSAVWGALVLRANLVSTFPVDVFRKVGDVNVEVETPPVLLDPAGDGWGINDWMFATQFDLDRVGNCYGIITKTDANGDPAEVQLVDHNTVTVVVSRDTGVVTYRIAGKVYPREQIWHERANPVPGMPMGLSPIAYAAWSIGVYQSAQQFALEWFANGAQIPSGIFKNSKKELATGEAPEIKERFKSAVQNRDVLVVGNDWEYSTVNSAANDAQFIESQDNAELAAARYFGVPASTIDVNAGGQNVTYANLSQDNLRFLILFLQPAVTRRERALSKMVARPRFVKLNTESLLRMDPKTKAEVNEILLRTNQRTVTEVREKDNLAPYSVGQQAELEWLASLKTSQTDTTGVPA